METIAADVSRHFQLPIAVFGFGAREGRPAPVDYRDVPYLWSAGEDKTDAQKLQPRLTSAKLILGDLAETLPHFLSAGTAVSRVLCNFVLQNLYLVLVPAGAARRVTLRAAEARGAGKVAPAFRRGVSVTLRVSTVLLFHTADGRFRCGTRTLVPAGGL